MTDYEIETGQPLVFEKKRSKGRPKVEGAEKSWDIRLTPTDQVEVDFTALDLSDFKILLICKEGEPDGKPRLHYHMYAVTTRSDTYIDTLLNKLGKATQTIKGNAVYSKRNAHDQTMGYVVKNGDVKVRHGINDQFLTEIFKKSENYRKEKETERKKVTRSNENFLSMILKDAEVKRLADPMDITAIILKKYREADKRFPPRSAIESAVMYVLYDKDPKLVISHYAPRIFSEY